MTLLVTNSIYLFAVQCLLCLEISERFYLLRVMVKIVLYRLVGLLSVVVVEILSSQYCFAFFTMKSSAINNGGFNNMTV